MAVPCKYWHLCQPAPRLPRRAIALLASSILFYRIETASPDRGAAVPCKYWHPCQQTPRLPRRAVALLANSILFYRIETASPVRGAAVPCRYWHLCQPTPRLPRRAIALLAIAILLFQQHSRAGNTLTSSRNCGDCPASTLRCFRSPFSKCDARRQSN